MSVVVIVQEVKYQAVRGFTPEQVRRWQLWLQRHADSPRVRALEPITMVGNDWEIQCDDREHAEWLRDWLIRDCGFTRTMLTIKAGAS